MKGTHRSIRSALVGVGGLLLVAACGEEPDLPVYQMVALAEQDIIVTVNAAGSVQPQDSVEVKSKASGEIISVEVETGDVVRPGQLLVRVDPRNPKNTLRQAEADLDVAEAQLANAQSQLGRAEELHRTQSITETEFDAAKLQFANAKAAVIRAESSLENAKIAFEDTDVRAPARGVILTKNIDVGTVISSATGNISGGTVLLKIADLDTVQVRALVDETDIGKIRHGLDVTIVVDAYPNRPFRGQVLKIEPQATVQQNVTMFPVAVKISNDDRLLKPGMNAEIEIHVGERSGVLTVPNAALRTQRDVASAAGVLGLEPEAVREQLAAARKRDGDDNGEASLGGATPAADGGAPQRTISVGGHEVPLPPGVTEEQVQGMFQKMRRGGGPQSLSAAERRIMGQLRGGGGGGGRRGGGRRAANRTTDAAFGGEYIVFVVRDGQPMAVPVRTGLTDLDNSEVVSGLAVSDTVLVLPSASLVASQQAFSERVQGRAGLPGVQRR